MEDIIDECDIPFDSEIIVKEATPKRSPRYVMKIIVLIYECIIVYFKYTHNWNI